MSLISGDNTVQSLTSAKVSILPHIPSDINIDLNYWRKQLEIAKVNAQAQVAQLQVQKKKTEQARLALERERLRLNASPSGPVSSRLGDLHLVPKFSKLDAGRHSKGYDSRGRTNDYVIPPEAATLPVTHESKGKYSNRVKSCFYCGKAGHQVRDCWAREEEFRDSTVSRPVNLVSTLGPLSKVGEAVPALRKKRGCERVVKDPFCGNYNAFLSEGYVSRCGVRRKVTVLRVSGSLQSLMLDGLVPRGEFGDRVLLDGLSGPKEAPLVDVRVETDLFTGHALIGVVDRLPVSGVDFVLGSDLAGGKMNPMPVLPTGPVESTEAVQLDEEVPELVCNHDDARSMTAGTAGRVPDDIAVETEEVKTSERKLCDTLSPGVASVETVDLETLHESEASERKLCDTLSPGVSSVETADLKTLHESEASERKLCDTLSPGVDFVKTEEVKSLPTSESSERKLCDTLSPGVDSVETEGLSHAHLREKTLPEDEISEEKMCDASSAVYESVQESVGETEDLSRAHSRETQERRTVWYDKRSRLRRFEAGDEVLLLLQQSGQPLVVLSKGSYTIIWSVRGSNYLVSTPDKRRGRRLCHVNMPKPYFSRDPPPLEPKVPVCIILRPAVAVCDEVDDVAACASKTWDPGGGVRELKCCLYIVGYYRMFIVNFATVVTPLTDLLKNDIRCWE
ncbi:uncharacterized protein [Panulirus ornatus]|uniref:uncharacterized protein isoform X2 n=1 Tax=Panulirus ornatus TaxID=150431 RepID=UPI003A889A7B